MHSKNDALLLQFSIVYIGGGKGKGHTVNFRTGEIKISFCENVNCASLQVSLVP